MIEERFLTFKLVRWHMAHRFPRPDVIERVWSLARDGRWHSRGSLVERSRFGAEEVAAALHFLVRYDFAETSTVREERFRMISDGPSPMEAANLLRVVEIEAH